MIKFFKKHLLILSILVLAAFLRLYRIGDYMTFLGDEGRDVLVVKHIIEGDLTLLGPRASAGDFFLGPIYYYLMTPFLWLWNFDPVGPAIMVALIGVFTVFLVYYIGQKFFSQKAGLIAALFYSISPIVIVYSRSSWNPNVMPFFTTFAILILYYAIKNNVLKYFLGVGILLGIILQLHYLGTFVAVIIALIILFSASIPSKKSYLKGLTILATRYLVVFTGFIIGFIPFIAFEIKNGFPNFRNIIAFIFSNTMKQDYGDTSYSKIIIDVYQRLFGRLLVNFPEPQHLVNYDDSILVFWKVGILIISILAIVSLFKMENRLQRIILLTWLFVGILLFGLYKKPIYDYYFGFLFPLPFLLFGNLIDRVSSIQKWRILWISVAVFLVGLVLLPNLYYSPVRFPPNKQRAQIQEIAEFVLSKTNGDPFNFALITPGNSDHGYRYFFELNGHPPVTIENLEVDPNRDTVTKQLLVVCEFPECDDILGYSLWEVAGFGRAEIVGKWPVSVFTVYKLRHYTPESAEQ